MEKPGGVSRATMLPRVLSAAACVFLLSPSPARAQIYAWRDANGTLVLSDKTIDGPTDVYVVEGAPAIRTTKPVVPLDEGNQDQYESLIIEHSTRQSIRPELVRAVIQVESGFNPMARSPKGAMGLMQLMPATARALGIHRPFDPDDNIRGGTTYLRQLLDRYNGDERLALAAYNAGSGSVDRYGGTVPPYRETREYVKKVGSAADATRTPTVTPTGGKFILYKTVDVIGDRAVPRYSTEKPTDGTFEIIH
jgi:soluble lytic murein transglycosylase-like protein